METLCSSPLVESCLTFVGEEQKQVGAPVKQAAPMLPHTLAQLLQSMRTRTQLAESLSQRITITRDIALYSCGILLHEPKLRIFHSRVTGPAATRVGGIGVYLSFRQDTAEVRRGSGGIGRCVPWRHRVHLGGPGYRLGPNHGLFVSRR